MSWGGIHSEGGGGWWVYVCGLCLETYTSSDGCYMSNMSSSNVTAGSGTLLWIYRMKCSQSTRLSGRVKPRMIVKSIATHISRHIISQGQTPGRVWNSYRFSSFSGCFTFLITHNPNPVNLTSSPSHKGSRPRPSLLSPPPNPNSRRASLRLWWHLLGCVTCHSSAWLI